MRNQVFCFLPSLQVHPHLCLSLTPVTCSLSPLLSPLSTRLFSSLLLSSPLLSTNESSCSRFQLQARASQFTFQSEAECIQKNVTSFIAIIDSVTVFLASPTFYILPSVSWPTTISQHQSYSRRSRPFLQQPQHFKSTAYVSMEHVHLDSSYHTIK